MALPLSQIIKNNMKKTNNLKLATTLLCMLLPMISINSYAENSSNNTNLKIGSISSVRIMAEAKIPKALQAKIESIAKKNETELKALSNKGNTLLQKFEKDMPTLSDNEKEKRKQELDQIDAVFRTQQTKYQQEISAVRDVELPQAMNNISILIRTFAKQENFDLIVQDTVYASPNIDVTDKVLKILNQ
jgi:outer membrane protein